MSVATELNTEQHYNNGAVSIEGEEEELQNDDEEAMKSRRRNRIKKIIIGVVLVAFIIYVIVDSLTTRNVRKGIEVFLKWIEENPVPGVFAFMGVYFVATILFAPGSILTLGSGFVFANAFGLGTGVLLATVSVFVGASLGAVAAFLLGRYLLRDWVKTLTLKYPVFEAIDTALEEKGFRIMALLRLSPIIPFNALNYIAGITAVRFAAYTSAMIAILPGTILYVFLGASAGSLADSTNNGGNSVVQIVTIVVGIAFGILGIGLTSYYAKKELRKVIERREAQQSSALAENNINGETVVVIDETREDGDNYGTMGASPNEDDIETSSKQVE